MQLKRLFILIALFVVSFGAAAHVAFAAGNIDATNKYSQFLNIDLDSNSVNDFVNWNPTSGGATVADTGITGTIWGETVGWINLAPAQGGVTLTCGANPTSDPAFLSGYAWGQNTGWINFAPTAAVGVNKPQINPTTGAFSGYVWSQNYGYLNLFSPAGGHPGVITSWRGCGVTPPPPPPPGCTVNCSNGGGPVLTVSTTVTNTNGGAASLSSFHISVKDHGLDLLGSPYVPSATPQSFGVLTGDTYHVQVNDPAAYTVVYGGACSNQGDVTINAGTQDCTVALYDGPVYHADYCPNISGVQSSVPSGYTVDSHGDCVPVTPPPGGTTDVCPNIAGDQQAVPAGMVINSLGQCVTPNNPHDFCPNIPGAQNAIPAGMTYDASGNCVPVPSPATDVCPNLTGNQQALPLGYTFDNSGNCVPENQYIHSAQSDIPLLSAILGSPGALPLKNSSLGWILPILAIVGLLSTVPGLVTRFANILFAFLFARKRARGIVYDSENKEPLDPAYISVIDVVTGKEVMSQITDIHGRYGFILEPGTYRMTAGKTHYTFPSAKLAGLKNDEVYSNLYFGEPFTIVDKNQVVTMNIPMDRVAVDWNQIEKERMSIVKIFTNIPGWLTTVFDVLFVLGFIASLLIVYYQPSAWNIVIVALYIVIGITQALGYGPVHAGVIRKHGAAVPFAIIRAFNANLNHEIAHTVTSSAGGYYMLVPKAHYYVTVEVKNAAGQYERVYTSATLNASHGLINKPFNI